jgi:hypothetical protein
MWIYTSIPPKSVLCGQRNGFLDQEPLLFHSTSSSLILMRLSGPRSGPTTSLEPRISGYVVRNSDHQTTEAFFPVDKAPRA